MESQIKLSLVVIVAVLFCRCSNNNSSAVVKQKESNSFELGSYEIMPSGDTLNIMDSKNRKQGIWYETDLDNNPYTKKIDTVYYKNGVTVKQP